MKYNIETINKGVYLTFLIENIYKSNYKVITPKEISRIFN